MGGPLALRQRKAAAQAASATMPLNLCQHTNWPSKSKTYNAKAATKGCVCAMTATGRPHRQDEQNEKSERKEKRRPSQWVGGRQSKAIINNKKRVPCSSGTIGATTLSPRRVSERLRPSRTGRERRGRGPCCDQFQQSPSFQGF